MTTKEFGDYRLDHIVGKGRMGIVYRGVDRRSGREVAVKLLRDSFAADPLYRPRFEREAQLLGALRHPNVVPIYEAGEVDGHLYLVMRLLSGRTLKDLVQAGPLDVEDAMGVLEPVASALGAAHAAGIVHRDVKPRNVLLGAPGEVFLGDFGLARGPDAALLTAPGEILGTLDYMSPEHLDGQRAGAPADVYALACTAVEALTGEVPFPRDSAAAVMLAHVAHDPPRVSARRPALPEALDDVLAGGMAKDPDERPSAGALLAGMRDAVGAAPLPAVAAG